MNDVLRQTCLFVVVLATLTFTSLASAVEIADVAVGLAGQTKPGHWTPVWVTLKNIGDGDYTLRMTTNDNDGVPVHYVVDKKIERTTEDVRVWGYVKFGSLRPTLSIDVLAGGERVVGKIVRGEDLGSLRPSTDYLVVTLGPSIGIEDAVAKKLKGRHTYHTANVEEMSALPDHWSGYESVDMIALGTADLQALIDLHASRLPALTKWVSLGGRLIVTSAKNAPDVFAAGKPLAELAPGTIANVIVEEKTTDVSNYVSSNQTLPSFNVAVISEPRGFVQQYTDASRDAERPLIIHSAHGLGTVTVVTADLDAAPFDSWDGRDELVARIVRASDEPVETVLTMKTRGKATHLGYKDIAGQLRGTLDRFSSMNVVAFSLIATLICIYVLLIGPGDYFFLKRLRRMHWSWVTFPLIVIGFAALAVYLLGETKDQRIRINQLDIVDIDAEQGFVRGTTWAHLYSPTADVYSLDVALGSDIVSDPSSLLTWQGLPGESSLGGIDVPSTQTYVDVPYTTQLSDRLHPQTTLEQLPIQTSSTKSLLCRWHGQLVRPTTSKLYRDQFGALRGDFEYPIDYELEDWMLFYGEDVYWKKLPLRSGQITSVGTLSQRNMLYTLQRRFARGMSGVSTPYDAANLEDVPRMLDMMMFYDRAGGAAYTKLTHRYQSYLDLSPLLRDGQAVLVGRTMKQPAELRRDGESLAEKYDQRWTYVRLVLPVASAEPEG